MRDFVVFIMSVLTCFFTSLYASTSLFSVDFSDPNTLQSIPTQIRLGTGQGAALPENFTGLAIASQEADIQNQALELSSTSNFRGIGIVIDDDLLGAQNFTLSLDLVDFDVPNTANNINNDAFLEISIVGIEDFDTSNSNSVNLSTFTGSASAPTGITTFQEIAFEELTFGEFESANPSIDSVDFDFTLNTTPDALVIFIGANNAGAFPNPQIIIDNISLSSIPEPHSVSLLCIGSLILLGRRVRK